MQGIYVVIDVPHLWWEFIYIHTPSPLLSSYWPSTPSSFLSPSPYSPSQLADEWLERDDILTTLATTDSAGVCVHVQTCSYIHVHMCSNFLVELIMWGLLQLLPKKIFFFFVIWQLGLHYARACIVAASVLYGCYLHTKWTWEQCS